MSRGSVSKNTCFSTSQMTFYPSEKLAEIFWYSLIRPRAKKRGVLMDFVVGAWEEETEAILDVMVFDFNE